MLPETSFQRATSPSPLVPKRQRQQHERGHRYEFIPKAASIELAAFPHKRLLAHKHRVSSGFSSGDIETAYPRFSPLHAAATHIRNSLRALSYAPLLTSYSMSLAPSSPARCDSTNVSGVTTCASNTRRFHIVCADFQRDGLHQLDPSSTPLEDTLNTSTIGSAATAWC